MKILIVLTYYRPHISGLTIYAERMAKAFAQRGHKVTVLTARFNKACPLEEEVDGVRIIRAPVLFRLSKGVIMPTFGALANRLVKETDVIQLHLPQFDAAGIALRGRLLKKPTVSTYHCDLELPPGLFNRIANSAVTLMNQLTAKFTHRIVSYTRDYAENSSYLKQHLDKVTIIPPPVFLPKVSQNAIDDFDKEHNPEGKHPVIGIGPRFATEKGIEILLQALPKIIEANPNLLVQFYGPYKKIIGEESYYQRLLPVIQNFESSGHWSFMGSLNPEEMAAFYPNLDVLVLPSLNATESFGLVQIEAMMSGVPCVTSSLPGVRQPILTHKLGRIFPIGDSKALANEVIAILSNGKDSSNADLDFSRYLPDKVAQAYEELFENIKQAL